MAIFVDFPLHSFIKEILRYSIRKGNKATLLLFVGLQLFHPQNHVGWGIKIKTKSQYML
jgi:hypothetical protein